MSHEQFEREKNYRISLAITKMLLSNNLITRQEFHKIDAMLIAEYKPVIGSL